MAMDCSDAYARGGRNEDLEKLYQNGLFGGCVLESRLQAVLKNAA